MKQAVIYLEELSCPSCLQKIEHAIKGSPAVDQESVNVYFNASKVKLSYDESIEELDQISQRIQAMGYEVKKTVSK